MKHLYSYVLILMFPFLFKKSSENKYDILPQKYGLQEMRQEFGGDLATAVSHIVKGFPSIEASLCFDGRINPAFIELLLKNLEEKAVSVVLFNISSSVDTQEKFFDYLGYKVENHLDGIFIFFGTHRFFEHVLLEVYSRNYIRRNLFYIFNWGEKPFNKYFLKNIHYAMKILAITNPRTDTFRIFYNRDTSHREHHLDMVNWWNQGKGLFSHPTLPRKKSVYTDFHGKTLRVPVLHKPPWHFVHYNDSFANGSFKVVGGRDDRILNLMANKLNFRYNYFDPPERTQGSATSENSSNKGVLWMIWKREADLFIGDVALTYERSNLVEFSFITLADSGAFVTHAPNRLNEALALLRPFHWQVWPAIGATFCVVGPALYAIIALPNSWQPRFRVRSHIRLFFDCTWFTITILLKQTGKDPSSSYKARFFIMLLSFSTTYVISDMYSANLTSLLARPGIEKPIHNLYQLENVMLAKDFKLYVEEHSSSFALLENGTGIYARLWNLMQKRQNDYLVESVEEGVKLVRGKTNVAVIAGRETLFFDIQRFGPTNFHLSEKLNTAYSAIALQLGCPYIEEVNRILMAIFEAGIITRMTENEYEKLGKQKEIVKQISSADIEASSVPTPKTENRRAAKVSESNEKLKPISLKMLQGSFYLLCIGSIFAGLVLGVEVLFYKHHTTCKRVKNNRCIAIRKYCNVAKRKIMKLRSNLVRIYRNAMHEAFLQTLEYIE